MKWEFNYQRFLSPWPRSGRVPNPRPEARHYPGRAATVLMPPVRHAGVLRYSCAMATVSVALPSTSVPVVAANGNSSATPMPNVVRPSKLPA